MAKGFTQRRGIDFDDTYASVVKPSSVRALLTIAANKDWRIRFDITRAFLHADLDRPVFVEQPHGFQRGNKVCLLKKALYGLKQSPLLWFGTLKEAFHQLKFIAK